MRTSRRVSWVSFFEMGFFMINALSLCERAVTAHRALCETASTASPARLISRHRVGSSRLSSPSTRGAGRREPNSGARPLDAERRSGFEVVRPFDIGEEPRLAWAPSQPLLRARARGRNVDRKDAPEPAKMTGCLFERFGDDRHAQASADDVRDVSGGHALVGNPVKPGSRRTLLERQPKEMGGIEPVHRGPSVTPLARVRRDALLSRDANKCRYEGMIAVTMNRRREAHH